MDYESTISREKGCWDPKTQLGPFYEGWSTSEPTPDFVVEQVWRGLVASVGFGAAVTEAIIAFWDKTLQDVYKGDEGRRKVRMALGCLLDRDGLLRRVRDIKCPVYWLQVSSLHPQSRILLTAMIGNRGPRLWKDCACRAHQRVYVVTRGYAHLYRGGWSLLECDKP